jgi:DNA transposition AAA+ family ATPase
MKVLGNKIFYIEVLLRRLERKAFLSEKKYIDSLISRLMSILNAMRNKGHYIIIIYYVIT